MRSSWRENLWVFVVGVFWMVISSDTRADLWSTGYYPGYRQSSMPASAVDFSALTHVIHFALLPNSDGTLNSSANSITTSRSSDLVTRAHAAGKKVLICVAGGGDVFTNATSAANLGTFTTNLVNFMTSRGYDGVDIDWEPITNSETNQFATFITTLRTKLDTITPRPMLTVAVAWQPRVFATLQSQFDQINIMTYDMAGTWPGWVTWHNAPIFDGGYRFPSTGALIPSAEGLVNSFTSTGVLPQKLGIGIAFYGKIWTGGTGTTTGGATQPRQSWTSEPTLSTVTYATIMSTYYQSNNYVWDTNAQAAYLSFDNPGSTNDMFISYDDEHTCQAKVSYARNRRLGGVMIWELGEGYRASEPVGKRDPLLQTIKQSLQPPRLTSITRSNQNIQLSFSSLPLGAYRIQWTTNLASGTWNTLSSNLVATGTNAVIIDTNAVSNALRFYRVQTPP